MEVLEEMTSEGTEDISSYVRKLRSTLGLNQTEFAKAWGVSTPTVSRIESGERVVVGYVLLRKLVDEFHVSPKVLFPAGNDADKE